MDCAKWQWEWAKLYWDVKNLQKTTTKEERNKKSNQPFFFLVLFFLLLLLHFINPPPPFPPNTMFSWYTSAYICTHTQTHKEQLVFIFACPRIHMDTHMHKKDVLTCWHTSTYSPAALQSSCTHLIALGKPTKVFRLFLPTTRRIPFAPRGAQTSHTHTHPPYTYLHRHNNPKNITH